VVCCAGIFAGAPLVEADESPTEQTLNYQRLLLHVLAEAETRGFTLGVLVAGHDPLIDHARSAALLYPDSGDHAAGWETSHMLALHPETVDLSQLPPKGAPTPEYTASTGEASRKGCGGTDKRIMPSVVAKP
jgi:hypothetical protein